MAIPFYDNIDLNNNKIINLKAPENDGDVSNKKYIDDSISALNTTLNAKILEEKADLKDYVDNELLTINTNITNVSNSIDTKIQDSIVDNLYTSDAEKTLSANQGVELRTRLDNLNNSIVFVNNYNSVEDGESLDGNGSILGYAYKRCLIPIFIDEAVTQQIQEYNLYDIVGDNAIIFKVSAYIIENNKIHYINTDDIKLIDYDILQFKLKLEFSQTLLPELEDNTLYLIIEFYNDVSLTSNESENGGE